MDQGSADDKLMAQGIMQQNQNLGSEDMVDSEDNGYDSGIEKERAKLGQKIKTQDRQIDILWQELLELREKNEQDEASFVPVNLRHSHPANNQRIKKQSKKNSNQVGNKNELANYFWGVGAISVVIYFVYRYCTLTDEYYLKD